MDAPKSGMAWQMQNGPTMMDHWKSVYSKAYGEEHGNIPIDRGSIMHEKAHDAALKAVVLAVAESVSDAIKNVPLIEGKAHG